MANYDVRNDTTPQMAYKKADEVPTITALRSALSGAGYAAATMNTMTRNDMIYAARVGGLSVTGL